MTKTPSDMIAELFKQIGALGKQVDASDDSQAAAAQIEQSLGQLREVIAEMDAGEDAQAVFAQVTTALEMMRKELKIKNAGAEDAMLAGLEDALKQDRGADEMAQALDEETAGAFSHYRAANEAKAMDEVRQNAQANAQHSAKQVKPNLDFSAVTKQDDEGKG